jgi:SAM-dependent methyltransferase
MLKQAHVHDVYDKIAPHFNETRTKLWDGSSRFLSQLPENSLVVDIGCGNGRSTRGALPNKLRFVGNDTCIPLLEIAAKSPTTSALSFIAADGLNLPYMTGSFDAAVSIAVLHHLPCLNTRRRFIDEALRVIRPGGFLYMTVWADSENTDKRKEKKWEELGTPGDYLVPWHNKHTQQTHYRYYHMFEKDEVYALFKHIFDHKQAGFVNLEFEQDNWNMTIKKCVSCITN